MIKWLKSIATYVIAIVLSFGVGFGTSWLVKDCAKEIIEVTLTESQKQQIIQDARLGWITLDSAKTLVVDESKIKWIPTPDYYDSLRITDSLNIIDSVVYIAVYESGDTNIVLFNGDTSNIHIELEIGLNQRFFPAQERFGSSLWLNRLNVSLLREVPVERTYGPYMIGIGLGARFEESYFFGDFTYKLVNTNWFEIPIALRMEYNVDKVLSGGIETKLQVKF